MGLVAITPSPVNEERENISQASVAFVLDRFYLAVFGGSKIRRRG